MKNHYPNLLNLNPRHVPINMRKKGKYWGQKQSLYKSFMEFEVDRSNIQTVIPDAVTAEQVMNVRKNETVIWMKIKGKRFWDIFIICWPIPTKMHIKRISIARSGMKNVFTFDDDDAKKRMIFLLRKININVLKDVDGAYFMEPKIAKDLKKEVDGYGKL